MTTAGELKEKLKELPDDFKLDTVMIKGENTKGYSVTIVYLNSIDNT